MDGGRMHGEMFGDLLSSGPTEDVSMQALHAELLGVLRDAVPASFAFCYAGSVDGSAVLGGSVWSRGRTWELQPCAASNLSEALACSQAEAAWLSQGRHANRNEALRLFKCQSLLLVRFHSGLRFLGMGGVAASEPSAFDAAALAKLERSATLVSAGIGWYERWAELRRREVVNGYFPDFQGTRCVIELDSKRLVWSAASAGQMCADAALSAQAVPLAAAAEALLRSPSSEPLALECGVVVAAAALDAKQSFCGGRYALLAIKASPAESAESHGLSPREQEIAHLLMGGFAVINVAALLQLSEHTVRTYIRRLYRKLNVSNRADLVRKLMLPMHASLRAS